jgi:hypothetical protein
MSPPSSRSNGLFLGRRLDGGKALEDQPAGRLVNGDDGELRKQTGPQQPRLARQEFFRMQSGGDFLEGEMAQANGLGVLPD